MLLKYRTVLYLLACLFCCGQAWAQEQQHYVYIQSEKGQPFYVKVNGQVLSSTERGYIILPKLESGTVPMSIGYAQSEGPAQEQKFHVRIAKNDQGFLLKKGALYNLQTFREIKADNGDGSAATAAAQETAPEAVAANAPEDTTRKEMMGNLQKELEDTFSHKATVTGPGKPSSAKSGNAFSSALDKVVVSGDDREEPVVEAVPAPVKPTEGAAAPAEETVVKKPRGKKHKAEREPLSEEEQDILKSVMAEESKAAASEAAVADQPKQEAEEQPAPKKQKKHKKREGDPDFIEFQEEGKASVPAPTPAPAAVPVETTAPAVELPATEEAPVRKKKKRKLFDDTEHPNNIITDSSGYGVAVGAETPARKKKRNDDAVAEATEKKDAGTRLINTDCGNVMDEATFRKVLRKFVSAKSDETMIDVFRKSTRNYCLETAQVKSLALLVSSDEARYRLLDLAYAKTYDTEKYGSLESLLTESYYKGRFRAMLHK
ncbi:DUF4476 domain-containing protein [Chitinophaga varians]|uniref:DUF4476 domain-containing protein n=1 Tax=Chitinophaga varians TaxID=2202339 RepID=UPI00165F271D|nr:DUF4476 domain-containing protein [Chitinophaga varians]MBC9910319.1 DUF4476 domain-containing protein [Chitinophaga varians]